MIGRLINGKKCVAGKQFDTYWFDYTKLKENYGCDLALKNNQNNSLKWMKS